MENKSAYIVLGMGTIFVIYSVFNIIFSYSTSTLVIALISVVASLISLSDILNLTRFKKYGNFVLILALLIFMFLMIAWLLPINFTFPFLQVIGESFTVIALGLVIGLFGLKEILESNNEGNSRKKSRQLVKQAEICIIINEYEEMMKLNDIIERLKKIDQKVFPHSKVHNGWGFLSDSLEEHFEKWNGPFFDELNKKKYREFLDSLDQVTEDIGNVAEPNPRLTAYEDIEMWNESFKLTIQPIITGSHTVSIEEINKNINRLLLLWKEVKNQVTERYERQRQDIQKSSA